VYKRQGQPPYFKTPEELQKKIDEYFDEIEEKKERATITGIALYLGFCSRQSMYDYENRKEYSYTIKKARLMIENRYEQGLGSKETVTGSIFALKQFKWSDKVELDIPTSLTIEVASAATKNKIKKIKSL